MKRILVGFIMDGKAGGIDTYLLQFLDTVWNEEVQIDFLTNEISSLLQQKIEKYHSKLFQIASLRHPVRQYRQVCEIIEKGRYEVAYFNVSTAIDCVAAFAAKRMGVSERILHSHSSGNDCENGVQRIIYNVIHRICRVFFYKAGTRFCSCSQKAGYWLLPPKIVESASFEVVFNAVDREKFIYNKELQTKARAGFDVEGKFVIGHIGNFCYAKNYPFLIDIFSEMAKSCPNTVFLLAGTGIEMEAVKQEVQEKGLEERVRFLGWIRDTNEFYHALDVLLLPSRFEGLPIVGVEAQCTKLACVMSDSVTSEAKIQDHCYFLDLKDGPEKWAESIRKIQGYNRNEVRLLKEAKKYNLETQKKQLLGLIDKIERTQ